jgi:hypothetical protein
VRTNEIREIEIYLNLILITVQREICFKTSKTEITKTVHPLLTDPGLTVLIRA